MSFREPTSLGAPQFISFFRAEDELSRALEGESEKAGCLRELLSLKKGNELSVEAERTGYLRELPKPSENSRPFSDSPNEKFSACHLRDNICQLSQVDPSS